MPKTVFTKRERVSLYQSVKWSEACLQFDLQGIKRMKASVYVYKYNLEKNHSSRVWASKPVERDHPVVHDGGRFGFVSHVRPVLDPVRRFTGDESGRTSSVYVSL